MTKSRMIFDPAEKQIKEERQWQNVEDFPEEWECPET